jgi:ABC-type amino acid transport substrate-binding protein
MYKKRIFTFLLLILSTTTVIFTNLVICNSLPAQATSDDIVQDFIDGTKKELNIGFRVQSYPISYVNPDSIPSDKSKSYYTGFCNIFADKLFEDLKIHLKNELSGKPSLLDKVDYLKLVRTDVINFPQDDPNIKRYGAVINKQIDVECGANAIRKDLNEIEFSNDFLQDGISLLTKKEKFEEIRRGNFSELKVGVVSGTTTYQWLHNDILHNKILPYSSRPKAISSLKDSQTEAYASNYIILRGVLERDRNLRDKYDVYPGYLKPQKYGLVIKKGQSRLKEIINNTINDPEVKAEIEYLNNTYSLKSTDSTPKPDIDFLDKLGKVFSNPLHSLLLGILISAFVLLATITPFRQKISEVISGVWTRICPDIVNWLCGLWQLLIKLLFKK